MAFSENQAEVAELRLRRSLKVLRHEIDNLTEDRRMPIDLWVSERLDQVISKVKKLFAGRVADD